MERQRQPEAALKTTGPVPKKRRLTSAGARSWTFDIGVSCGVLALAALTAIHTFVYFIAPAMALMLLVRRRWPLSVMAMVSALALAQVIATPRPYVDPLPFDLAVLVAMYSVVKYGRRMLDAYVAAGFVLTGVMIEVVRHDNRNWWIQVLFYVAVAVGVWLGGYIARTRRTYLLGLEERAATLEREREHLAEIAVAQERAAIAREMHDVVAHSLAVIIVQADGGRYAMAQDPDQGRATLETVATTAREALDEMRRLIELLRHGSDDRGGEEGHLVLGVSRLEALVTRAREAGMQANLTIDDVSLADNSTASVAIYRLVQEGLTNVLRHAGARARCDVDVAREGTSIRVSVVDDGGAEPRPRREPDRIGHGLVGMRERVSVLGGTLTVGPRAGGWRVEAVIPVGERDAIEGDRAGVMTA